MKTKVLILFSLLSFTLFSQNRGFNYKALITENGITISNQSVTIRFTILQQSPVYTETINTTTDDNGIVSVTFGDCDYGVENEEFCNINWGTPTFLKVEIDTGNGFLDFGTNAFHYVPYAEYAANGGGAKSIDDLSDAKTTNNYGSIFFGSDAGASEALAGDVEANIGIGKDALNSVSTGYRNIAIGTSALEKSNGNGNIAIGNYSLSMGTSLNNNTVVGIYAFANNFGDNNTILGCSAGANNFSGSGNLFLGYQAGFNEAGSNRLYIDNSSTSTPLIYGEFDNDLVAINGTLKVLDGTQGDGKVLTSDADGLASWQTPASITNLWATDGTNVYRSSGNVGIGTTTPTSPLEIKSNALNTLIISSNSTNYNTRPGIQFKNNNSQFISGDDASNEIFGFYSQWASTRTYDARLRIYGKATSSWGKYLELTHNGTDATISTDVGNLSIMPEKNTGIRNNSPDETLVVGDITDSTTVKVLSKSGSKSRLKLFESDDYGFELEYNGSTDELNLWSKKFTNNEAKRMTWKKDGEVEINGKITSESSGNSADLKTFAYGTIKYDGTKYSGTNNFQVDTNAGEGIYKITFDGENYNYEHFTTTISLINTDFPREYFYYATNNTLVIKIWFRNDDGGISLTNNSFSFVTYKQ